MSWIKFLKSQEKEPYFQSLKKRLYLEYLEAEVLPEPEVVFESLHQCKFDDLKVVILGQDPYHTPGVADGLAFSTKEEKLPPSLRRIFQELEREYPEELKQRKAPGDLTGWANQGVLLLNTALTVRAGEPLSHEMLWRPFTAALIRYITANCPDVVFILLGKKAQHLYAMHRDESHERYVTAPHPSPLAKGFVGSDVFRRANEMLDAPIKWWDLAAGRRRLGRPSTIPPAISLFNYKTDEMEQIMDTTITWGTTK